LGQELTLFVGTYTGTGSKGIYTYSFNTETGALTLASTTDSGTVANPSYLALAPNGRFLYAVNETGGAQPGAISAFSVGDKGKLSFINQTPTGGDHPCFVAIHPDGNWAAAGNYSGGNVAMFPLNSDGSLDRYRQLVQHSGKGPKQDRQEKAHVHMTNFSPDGQHLLVPDLGTDQLHVYALQDNGAHPLQPALPPFVKSKGGSGPRHVAFHPNGRFAYLIEELTGTVAVYAYNKGTLRLVQRLSSHPKGYTGAIGSADIHVSADGKHLYASNRGDANNIAHFSIGQNGQLRWVGATPSGGRSPRNFTLSPDGKFLLAANQESNNIVVFKRDVATGKLTPAGIELTVPKPVCLVFAP
jgi:6-phosphogluconolactonase